jgi:DNA-binding PadR family transcriptional regulator
VKTIYNSLASVVADGLATKNSAKCYRLTDEGMAMLLKAEEDYEDQLPARKSAASTRLGRGML